MNPVDAFFQKLRFQGRKAFIPFVPAGDPDLPTTTNLVFELARRGCGPIEIGFPYSDPIADGSVIQAAYTRALQRGVRIDAIFDCVHQIGTSQPLQQAGTPLIGMVSYSLVFRRGPEQFLDQAQAAGLSGAIVPDLPLEETGALVRLARARDFKLIQLVTPTTPRDRAVRIAQASSGFLYCVSVTGITGERDRLPDELLEQLTWLRTQTDLPLCVGFGISKPEHARVLKPLADGIIVGSAIVRRLEKADSRSAAEIIAEIGEYVQTLIEPLL
jgi:tryptophan synthase alpha chain